MNNYKFYIVSFDNIGNLQYTYYQTQELSDAAKSEFGDSFISSGITEYVGSPGFRRPKIENFKFEKLSDDEIKTIKNISERLYKIIYKEKMDEDTEFQKVWKSYQEKYGKKTDFTKEMLYFDYKNPNKVEVKVKQEVKVKGTRKSARISNLTDLSLENFLSQDNSVSSEFAKILKENKVHKATVDLKNQTIKLYGTLSESEFKSKKLIPEKFIKYIQIDTPFRESRDD